MTAIRDYYDKNRWLRERYPEVSAVELYSSIFPLEMIEKKGIYRTDSVILFSRFVKCVSQKMGREKPFFTMK